MLKMVWYRWAQPWWIPDRNICWAMSRSLRLLMPSQPGRNTKMAPSCQTEGERNDDQIHTKFARSQSNKERNKGTKKHHHATGVWQRQILGGAELIRREDLPWASCRHIKPHNTAACCLLKPPLGTSFCFTTKHQFSSLSHQKTKQI